MNVSRGDTYRTVHRHVCVYGSTSSPGQPRYVLYQYITSAPFGAMPPLFPARCQYIRTCMEQQVLLWGAEPESAPPRSSSRLGGRTVRF
jgi:hypothetical protein